MQGNELNKLPSLDEVLAQVPERWRSALMDSASDLKADLAKLAYLGEAQSERVQVLSFRREGYSTYQLKLMGEKGWIDVGTIQFAPLFNGSYLIRRTLLATMQVVTYTEQYDENGAYVGRYHDPSPNLLYVNLTDMEPRCPVVSHLYNILLYEYQQAESGQANSVRIRTLEGVLRDFAKSPDFHMGYCAKFDEGIHKLNEKILQNEIDPALTFSDKGAVRVNLKKERATIIRTKKRVHGSAFSTPRLALLRSDLTARLVGIRQRPVEKTLGTTHKYTIGIIAWFFGIVRNNIGYSVALAIYAPFTYYFITQPMNPGAVWTVGQIRKAYISTVGALSSIGSDTTETKLVVENSEIHSDPRTPYEKMKGKNEDFLVSTDVPSVEKQSWSQRMGNFKQMQITYEANLLFSQRMGRLEQMENQLNFPLIAEAAYRDLDIAVERVRDVQNLLKARGQYTPEASAYLESELKRGRQFKLYIWDKVVRYMLDFKFIVLNADEAQEYVDYYIGRNFIFIDEITKDLSRDYPGFRRPEGYQAIEELAKLYRQKHVQAATVEERLQKNHFMHREGIGIYDGAAMRAKLKRQWEILYLSYNRAEEPSNFGLQMYVWSVRNAIWALGTLMGSKNRELELIENALRDGKSVATALKENAHEHRKIEEMYESLFHILTLEYASIRDELNGKLDHDLESTQRQAIIESLKKSFEERTQFLNGLK